MDDYCKKAQVFLNKDDELQYNLKKNQGLFRVYKKSLTNAFKHIPIPEEVRGLKEFLTK